MEEKNNMVNMTIRIDKGFKRKMDGLFKELGINTTSAIMMFLKQCDREKGLPFLATTNVKTNNLNISDNYNDIDDFDDIDNEFEDIY